MYLIEERKRKAVSTQATHPQKHFDSSHTQKQGKILKSNQLIKKI